MRSAYCKVGELMNSAHIHLILNHIPILGTIFGLLVLAAGMIARSSLLQKTGFITFIVTAVLTIPTYLTGEPAEDVVKGLPDISRGAIELHDQTAMIAFIIVGVLGIWALFALWRFRRAERVRWISGIALVLALAGTVTMIWTAELGGRIHHQEIRPGFQAPPESEH